LNHDLTDIKNEIPEHHCCKCKTTENIAYVEEEGLWVCKSCYMNIAIDIWEHFKKEQDSEHS
jgi:ribosomal protein L37AE/L43A